MKKVVIACESSSVDLKESVKQRLINEGYEVGDVGQQLGGEPVLYYEAAEKLAKEIQSGQYERGIAICGTGAGISMVLNKYRNIYAVACESVFTAEKILQINNANVLCMGSRVVSHDMGSEMALKYLEGKWCEGFAPERRKNNENGYAKLKSLEEEFYR